MSSILFVILRFAGLVDTLEGVAVFCFLVALDSIVWAIIFAAFKLSKTKKHAEGGNGGK